MEEICTKRRAKICDFCLKEKCHFSALIVHDNNPKYYKSTMVTRLFFHYMSIESHQITEKKLSFFSTIHTKWIIIFNKLNKTDFLHLIRKKRSKSDMLL